MAYWLLKTEPGTYSFSQLLKDKKTNWNGIRNFQARNYLKQMARGDVALIYHSGDDKAVVGIAKVSREAYPDPDPEVKGEWFQIDLVPEEKLKKPVPLSEIKGSSRLQSLLLVKQSRLSVMPVSASHYEMLLKMGGMA